MGYFDRVLDRRHNSYKVSKMTNDKYYKDDKQTIAYTVADMDFPVMPEVKEAICEYMEENTFGYTFPTQQYYDTLSDYFIRHHDFEFKKEDVLTFPGVLNIIEELIQTFTDENDGVLIFTPVYTPFYRIIKNNNRKLIECPLTLEGTKYTIDFNKLELLASQNNCKMILFCSPHNPVGRVWTKEELRKLSDIALNNDLLIISDEIHCDFSKEDHPHTMLANISKEVSDITMTCTSPSKTFNLAALNVANLIIKNQKLLGEVSNHIGKKAHNGANALGLVGCQAAYEKGDRWVKEINELLQFNEQQIIDGLKDYKNITVIPREGTYLQWIDCRNIDVDDLQTKLKECGIYCACGKDYGDQGDGFIRVNIACPSEYIEIFVNRMTKVLDSCST